MSVKIKARIPQDNGKQLYFGGGLSMTVGPEPCECCEEQRQAVVVVQGETDSFGWEPVLVCSPCLKKMRGEVDEYEAALDVEDREPKPGHLFLVSECNNADDGRTYVASFQSYRAARAYYRRCEAQAAARAGLYPNNGVREVPEEQASRAVRADREEFEREQEEFREWERERAEYEAERRRDEDE